MKFEVSPKVLKALLHCCSFYKLEYKVEVVCYNSYLSIHIPPPPSLYIYIYKVVVVCYSSYLSIYNLYYTSQYITMITPYLLKRKERPGSLAANSGNSQHALQYAGAD